MSYNSYNNMQNSRRQIIANFIAVSTALYGAYLIGFRLLIAGLFHLHLRPSELAGVLLSQADLIFGLSLLYLSVMLGRRKQNAWRVAVVIYGIIFILHMPLLMQWFGILLHPILAFNIIFPFLMLIGLWLARQDFTARSDIATFKSSILVSALVMMAAFVYGVSGFLLLDTKDFHQEVSFTSAATNTMDQFALLVHDPLEPKTRRAHLFEDSLSLISAGAVAYAVISFFAPMRARFSANNHEREHFKELLIANDVPSEDFFKLWPHDKQYFFDDSGQSGLAYRVQKGVALVAGDPVGSTVGPLLTNFTEICHHNDWSPAFIHVDDHWRKQYEKQGYKLQRIGQEAVLDIAHYQEHVRRNKYFRNIINRFNKAGYQAKLLAPPHSKATLAALRSVSDEWLAKPGRSERGFVMGYFTDDYMQQCRIWAAYDDAGQMQGFLNLLPSDDFDNVEATYDFLRQRQSSLPNTNDFLLTSLLEWLPTQGYQRLNLGLSPLAGLAGDRDADTVIDNILKLAYQNGDRFYSFSGLHRFKDKYEPAWSDRYVAYRGSLASYVRVMRALLQAMKSTKQ